MKEDTSSEKRRHARRETILPVDYFIDSLAPDETFEGVVADISESGLCLLTANPLKEGEKIHLKNIMHPLVRSASVRWVSYDSGLYFKVGLEFVQAD